ncbi:DoxX family protein [Varunaivibrio sulfuroxidans]|uniref:Putative oxidoreductase n=1 Tax=Varunaivibrio sulfuroxidans TaxID=1773489 RepID=A0A4R3JJC2_9PROT|nr:DoxX family protein [Varunaivibrio sulfuroxidans]TCS64960.1 putative oxidoreductase [Varunaivibrio sulfuroxidans]WES29748.1 DoxX family protein [Varunaivibrio sulfuroxidans]
MSDTPPTPHDAPHDTATTTPWERTRYNRLCVKSTLALLDRVPHSLIALLARLGVAGIFWRSGQLKIDANWHITSSTLFLFQDEYKVPLLSPELAAHLATIGEHLFPIMLVLGLGARLGAAGMLFMTLVIQTFVYPGNWPDHLMWASVLIYILAKGPGVLSLDHLFARRFL